MDVNILLLAMCTILYIVMTMRFNIFMQEFFPSMKFWAGVLSLFWPVFIGIAILGIGLIFVVSVILSVVLCLSFLYVLIKWLFLESVMDEETPEKEEQQ